MNVIILAGHKTFPLRALTLKRAADFSAENIDKFQGSVLTVILAGIFAFFASVYVFSVYAAFSRGAEIRAGEEGLSKLKEKIVLLETEIGRKQKNAIIDNKEILESMVKISDLKYIGAPEAVASGESVFR